MNDVKRHVRRCLVSLCFGLFGLGCGYQLQDASAPSSRGFVVSLAPTRLASSVASEALLWGARDALAAEGKLLRCTPAGTVECPELVLELLERSEGGAAFRVAETRLPVADARTFVLRARAFVRSDGTASPTFVVPSLEEREVLARSSDEAPEHAEVGSDEAERRVSRRLGARLVQTLLRQ